MLVLVAALTISAAEVPYAQFGADRYYLGNGSAPRPQPTAPWPEVALPSVVDLVTTGSATVVLDRAGTVYLLSTAGGVITPQCFTNALGPAGASLIGSYGTDGVVACSAESCAWCRCRDPTTADARGCTTDGQTAWNGTSPTVMAVSPASGTVYVASASGLWRLGIGTKPTRFGRQVAGNITAMAVGAVARGPDLAVATDLAVYHGFDDATGEFDSHELVGGMIDDVPTALVWVGADLWVGHAWCLNVIRSDAIVDRVSGAQGLPVGNVTSLSTTGSTLWIGTTAGVALLQLNTTTATTDRWRYFGGDRWLAGGSRVVSVAAVVAIAATPSAWVATETGAALIRSELLTLEAKAAVYTARTAALARYRWVASVALVHYGDQSAASMMPGDGDNDGLWTGMLVASQAFRYAVTGSADARDLAWHHFAAVEFLHNVTGTPGFIARSAVRCGDPHQPGDSGQCNHTAPHSCGWVNSSECYAGVDEPGKGCCWVWKRDTSSDEVTGHFFTLLVVHELLARTATEKRRAARLLCSSAAYLVDGGFQLIDPITKKRTSWGYWDPASLNGVPGKMNERGENSLEMLGYLAAAAKICDATSTPRGRFGAAFAGLVRDHRYDVNTLGSLLTSPQALAFFDFRLAFMSYQMLVMAVPELIVNGTSSSSSNAAAAANGTIPLTPAEAALFKRRLQISVRRYWGEDPIGATVDGDNNRVKAMDLVFRQITGAPGLADPDWQLRRYPQNLVGWPSLNSHRLDVRLDPDWLRCPLDACDSNIVVESVLPADEAFSHSSSDFVTEAATNSVDSGGGMNENAPNSWLLVYWMGRWMDSTSGVVFEGR